MIDAPAISDPVYQGYFQFKYEDFTNVDFVTIMAYDYQYDWGVGEPVAPEFWLKNVINWAKVRLPLEKIVIGIPAYGYHGTLGSYNMTIDTYAQSSTYPGFSTRKINSEGEEVWTNGNIYYSAQPKSSLDRKKTLIESLGIKNISVWHLGGNNWFSQN
jgi:spore germination protein YaaH